MPFIERVKALSDSAVNLGLRGGSAPHPDEQEDNLPGYKKADIYEKSKLTSYVPGY